MANWLQQITPDEYVASIYDIDLDKLWNMGKRYILTDLDNTLVPWNDPGVPESLLRWLEAARERGFKACILSNNSGPRVEAFALRFGIAFVAKARKPRQTGFQAALRQLDASAKETVMIGDQLFTDIRGGKRCGLFTILVLPISPKEWWGTRIVRQFERYAMRRLRRAGLKVPERTTDVEGSDAR